MNKITIAIIFSIMSVLSACSVEKQPADYVDPFIGTGEHGHTYPGATVPFGAVQLSPDNYRGVWDACSGYHYDRDSIIGFSHNHLSGTGCADLADILFHPTTKPPISPKTNGDIYEHYPYSHTEEKAEAGYYSVFLKGENIKAELTATTHTGWHRYTYPSGSANSLIIDMHHQITDETIFEADIEQTGANEVSGMRITQSWVSDQHIYFVAQFSKNIVKIEYIDKYYAYLTFEEDGEPLVAKVGLSIVSTDNARENLDSETSSFNFDFDTVRKEASDNWNSFLSKIKVTGGTTAEKRIFYTALYHTAMAPNITSDVNGEYRRNNNQISKKSPWGNTYSTLSLWDTFRSWLPLSTLIFPNVTHDIVFSSMDMYQAQGELPIWPLSSGETKCMIGYHSIPFIVDAYMKGIVPDLDVDKALEAMVTSSNINEKGSNYYTSLSFIPNEKNIESVSCLLEYAYDDWAISRFAEAIGHDKIRDEYLNRAKYYINVFDGKTAFFRAKNTNGLWAEPFNSFDSMRGYTEATPWQYRFFVPQDFNGLAQLFGGEKQLSKAVDEMFLTTSDFEHGVHDITGTIGQYAHGNEPSHHIAYIYNYLGEPWKTQELTRYIMDIMYDDTPTGLCGNEDCGQMSAWYVMSAIGLYDVCPGAGEFNFTTPLFDKSIITLPQGKTLTITANTSSKNKYIKSVTFNGKAIDRNYITFDEIIKGGNLDFVLSSKPNKERGISQEARPFSITSLPFVSTPFYDAHGDCPDMFIDSVKISLGCLTPEALIRYTIDGTTPDNNSPEYSKSLLFYDNATIRAIACKEGYSSSREMKINITKATAQEADKGTYKTQGVKYSYYSGKFKNTTEIISKGQFIKEGTLPRPSLEPAEHKDSYGLIFTGYICINEDGIWKFFTKSDDGSTLQIGEQMVIDNDGSHSVSFQEGKIYLKKGFYPYILKYFEDCEGEELQWYRQSPSEEEPSIINDNDLYIK